MAIPLWLDLLEPVSLLSVISKSSHPFGPVLRPDAAGSGPRTGRVKLGMPLQCPQLLESDLSDRPIHKQTIDKTVVSVDTSVPSIRRKIRPPMRRLQPCTTGERRHGAWPLNIPTPPVPATGKGVETRPVARAGWSLKEMIISIAADVRGFAARFRIGPEAPS